MLEELKNTQINIPQSNTKQLRKAISTFIQKMPPGQNVQWQKDCTQLYQRYAFYSIWETLIEGLYKTIQELYDLAMGLWKDFGDPSNGWIHTFDGLLGAARKHRDEVKNFRSSLEDNTNMIMLPRLNQDDDVYLFNLHLHDYLDSLLGDMYWSFNISAASGLNNVSSELYLTLPTNYLGNTKPVQARDLFSETSRSFHVGLVALEPFVLMGKEKYETFLGDKNIFDMMSIDFSENYQKKGWDLQTYVEEIQNHLVDHSQPMLHIGQIVQGNAAVKNYIATTPFAGQSKGATQIAKSLNGAFPGATQVTNATYEKMFSFIHYEYVINRKNWRYHQLAMGQYYQYQADYFQQFQAAGNAGNQGQELPYHIHVQEKLASFYELKINKDIHRNMSPQTSKMLDTRLVGCLESKQSLYSFLLLLLRNQFANQTANPNDPQAKLQFVYQNIPLGDVDDMYTVFETFLERYNQDNVFKNQVDSDIRAFVNAPGHQQAIDALKNDPLQQIKHIQGINVPQDLIDVAKVALNELLNIVNDLLKMDVWTQLKLLKI